MAFAVGAHSPLDPFVFNRFQKTTIRAKFLSTIPIGRFSTPEDMGNAACYLCSDEASMVTGVALEVDGGRCI